MIHRISTAIAAMVAIFTMATMGSVPIEAEAASHEVTTHHAVPAALPAGDRDDPSYRLAVEKRVEAYVTNKNGIVQFDLRLAQRNGENPDVIEVGKYLNAFAASDSSIKTRSWDEFVSAGSGMFSGYNYCGYGNRGGAPTNTLDRGCQLHDQCYDARGWGKCSCDSEFIAFIHSHSKSMGWTEWAQAKGAAAYFASKAALGKCKK